MGGVHLTVVLMQCFLVVLWQVDEPVMMRFPDQALEYGIDQLSSCFDGVSAPNVVKTVHLCCGYPDHLVSELFYSTVNSLLATTSCKQPPPVSNHFVNNRFVFQSIAV